MQFLLPLLGVRGGGGVGGNCSTALAIGNPEKGAGGEGVGVGNRHEATK